MRFSFNLYLPTQFPVNQSIVIVTAILIVEAVLHKLCEVSQQTQGSKCRADFSIRPVLIIITNHPVSVYIPLP